MTILYIINDEFSATSSVLQKVDAQISSWYSLGIKTHLYIIGVNKHATRDFVFNKNLSGFTYFNSSIANLFSGIIYRNLNRQLSIFHLLKTIKKVNPDLIYLREIQYFAFFDKVLTSRKSIIEINSLYLNEIGNLSQTKQNIIKRNQQAIFNAVAGFVCVTNEIANQIMPYNKPWVCCSNGVNMNVFNNEFIDNSMVNIVMICSPGMAWHGVEKLEILSKSFPQYHFHLIGPTIQYNATNLIQHGLLEKEEITRLYKSMNIALGCLSLYKKCMNESCSLKVREYLIHGLPMIMGEQDVDITGQPFVLEIGNYENNVIDNIEGIHNFIEKYKYVRLNKEQVSQLVSIEVKEKVRTDFFKKILTQTINN